jgi:hypothetical protein
MERAGSCFILALGFAGAVASVAGCAPDQVGPGYYGAADAGTAATSSTGSTLSAVTAASGDTAQAGISGAAGDGSMLPSAGTGAANAGSGGTGAAPMPNTAGSGAAPGASACDMSGRWLVTRHEVADGLGQLQTSHSWLYYEIEQQGDLFTVKKGLNCGHGVVQRTLLGANVDMHLSWPAVLVKSRDDGRTGTSKASAGGCEIHFDKITRAEGVTVPYYNDPSIPLAAMNDQAMGTTPGWEDWDADGHPGITLVLSGGITGEVYVAVRSYNELSGTAPDTSHTLKLADSWDQTENCLGYNGSPALTGQGVRASDPSFHFAELARLDPSQATGDDAAICAAIRSLAPTLTPNASDK